MAVCGTRTFDQPSYIIFIYIYRYTHTLHNYMYIYICTQNVLVCIRYIHKFYDQFWTFSKHPVFGRCVRLGDLSWRIWSAALCLACGGFHKLGYPNSWMVYKGKSIYKWVKIRGTPIDGPPEKMIKVVAKNNFCWWVAVHSEVLLVHSGADVPLIVHQSSSWEGPMMCHLPASPCQAVYFFLAFTQGV